MKKAMIAAVIIAGAVTLGGTGAFAAGRVAQARAVSEEDALRFACIDANIQPEDAENIHIEFERENGRFVYDVDFTANGRSYDYTIDPNSGIVLERESEQIPGQPAGAAQQPIREETAANTLPDETNTPSGQRLIAVADARSIALRQAGLSADEVTFTLTRLDHENGVLVYEIEFFVAGSAEYEYDIDALNGTILDEEVESLVINGQPVVPGIDDIDDGDDADDVNDDDFDDDVNDTHDDDDFDDDAEDIDGDDYNDIDDDDDSDDVDDGDIDDGDDDDDDD